MNTREIEISEEKSKTIETLSKDITSLKEKIRELEGRIENARTTATEWAKTITREHDKNVDLRAALTSLLADFSDMLSRMGGNSDNILSIVNARKALK